MLFFIEHLFIIISTFHNMNKAKRIDISSFFQVFQRLTFSDIEQYNGSACLFNLTPRAVKLMPLCLQ